MDFWVFEKKKFFQPSFRKNNIEGTPILKLAMVKRKKIVEKIKIRRKYSSKKKFVEKIKIRLKNSSKKFVEKISRKN